MATITAAIGRMLAESLVPKVDTIIGDLDDLMSEIVPAKGGRFNPYVGRSWEVNWTFRVGNAGATAWGPVGGPDMLTTPNSGTTVGVPNDYQQYGDVSFWPGLSEGTAQAYMTRNIALKKLLFSMFAPLEIIRAGNLGLAIGEPMEHTLEASARKLALQRINAFYSVKGNSQTIRGRVGQFTTGATPTIVPGTNLTITLLDATGSGETGTSGRRFEPGEAFDLYVSNSNTRVNSVPVFVSTPNPLTGTSAPFQGTIQLSITTGSITLANTTYDLVLRNSGRESGTNNLPTCLDETFLDPAGSAGPTSIYGVSSANFPQFGSLIRDVNSSLDEQKLMKYIARIQHARAGMWDIDTLVSTPGVWARLFQDTMVLPAVASATATGPSVYQRNGAVVTYKGGVADAPSFSFGGKNYKFLANSWVPAGTLYGMKLRNNWQRVTPPKLPGSGKHGNFGELEFIAPLWSGNSNIFYPLSQVGGANAGALTNMLWAPGEMHYELIPDQLQGLKLTRLTEFYG